MKVPFFSFNDMHTQVRAEMMNAFEKVYDSNWFILGKNVTRFEQEYAAFSGTTYCAGISNCLDALVLALQVLGVEEGDEVIVPSNTYIATVLAVTRLKAVPVFAEPDERTYNISPANIEKAITSKTKAVIPVHLYGQLCDMAEMMKIAEAHHIYVVEDNAQSHGAVSQGKMSGSWGHINATSFYPGKNLGALGDAGAITTNNEQWIARIKSLRNYGSAKKYYNEDCGYNMRLDELQAAFLSVKLPYINEWNTLRKIAAATYRQALDGIDEIVLPYATDDDGHVYHQFIIQAKQRDQQKIHLEVNGVDTMIHYPVPPHLQKAYAYLGYKKGDFPIAESLANSMLSLPIYPGIREEQIAYVASVIKDFYKK